MLLIFGKIAIDNEFVLQLVDNDLLAVNSQNELVDFFCLLKHIVQVSHSIWLVLEHYTLLYTILLRMILESFGPIVSRVGKFELD